MSWQWREQARIRLASETGPTRPTAGTFRVALGYPCPYSLAMASLGYAAVMSAIEALDGVFCDRFFLPDASEGVKPWGEPLFGYETGLPVSSARLIAISVAWELELTGLSSLLELSGIPPLAAHRSPQDPPVICGGPLTMADPRPLYPFADVVVIGEAEPSMGRLIELAMDHQEKPSYLRQVDQANLPGVVVPSLGGDRVVPRAMAHLGQLPAHSLRVSPDSAFPGMFLVELARGCNRRCTYCVMSSAAGAPCRTVPAERILQTLPADCDRVGLVGAAVTDHPCLIPILERLADRNAHVGLSSIRADRAIPRLIELLSSCGLKTLTTALDGPSQRLRDQLHRGTTQDHLLQCAQMTREQGVNLKIYTMVGLPHEEDEDVEELALLLLSLSKLTRVSLAISPFVPKMGTPLQGSPFAPPKVIQRRITSLKKQVGHLVHIRASSIREAWVEAAVAKGGRAAGLAAHQAANRGGTLNAWKQALKAADVPDPTNE